MTTRPRPAPTPGATTRSAPRAARARPASTSPENSRARDGGGYPVGETPFWVAELVMSVSPERVEQRLRFPQVRRVEAFGEPPQVGRELVPGFGAGCARLGSPAVRSARAGNGHAMGSCRDGRRSRV